MKRLIFLITFITLVLSPIAQEIQHETIAINIEVPVRVFTKGKFVEELTIKDFEVYEDGVLQKIEAVYLIKKTNIERKETESKEEEAEIKYAPKVSRNFILLFEIYEYLPKIGKAVEYFFNDVFLPGDTLKVVTPIKTYDFNVKALERFTGKEIAKELIGQLRKDMKMCTREYRSLLVDLENIRTAGGFDRQMKEMMYSNALTRLRNLRYVEEKRLLDFADFLKKMEGQKHVFLFHQKLVVPLFRGEQGDFGINSLKDFEAYISIDAEKVKQAFSDSSISVNFIFLTKTSGLDGNNTDGISVTARGLLYDGQSSTPYPEMQDLSGSVFSAFKEIAQTTGGTVDSSANAAASFKKVVKASENYYLLYYTPKDYKADGKFKNIKVKVKGNKYRITHRAGYIAD